MSRIKMYDIKKNYDVGIPIPKKIIKKNIFMSIPFVRFFKRKDIVPADLSKCVELGLITQEEKLRIEASRYAQKLDDYLQQKKKKK